MFVAVFTFDGPVRFYRLFCISQSYNSALNHGFFCFTCTLHVIMYTLFALFFTPSQNISSEFGSVLLFNSISCHDSAICMIQIIFLEEFSFVRIHVGLSSLLQICFFFEKKKRKERKNESFISPSLR